MSRIEVPSIEAATGASAEVYAQIKTAIGNVPNTFAAIGAHGPASLKAVLAADSVLATGTLSKQDQQVIKLLVSSVAGCDYCVAAHSLLGKMEGLSSAALRQVRTGEPSGDVRRDALIRFVRLLVRTTGTVDQAEFAAIKAAGYTDAQLVEISLAIAITMFTNVFNRINDTAIDFPAVS